MTTITITGKTIDGNFIDAPKQSCKPIDYPTKQRINVTIDGIEYNRAVYERVIWRNHGENTIAARFVIVNGINYEVAEIEEDASDSTEDNGTETEYIELLDENEDTGESLYAVRVLTGDVVSVIVDAEGTEWFNDDWQSAQPKSFAEVGDWRWYRGEEIDF